MNTKFNKLVLGSIVKYAGAYWVALAFDHGLVTIMAPQAGNTKLNVARRKVTVSSKTATLVNYKGKNCLVTKRGYIISMVSRRLLKSNTPDGKAILALAGIDPDQLFKPPWIPEQPTLT